MRVLVLVLLVALQLPELGCVQVEVNVEHSRGGHPHQDVGRVTSSDQAANTQLEIPVSLVPK